MTLDRAIGLVASTLPQMRVSTKNSGRGETREAAALARLRASLNLPVGDGHRWDAWHQVERMSRLDLDWGEEIQEAWTTVLSAGDARVLELLSGPFEPLVVASLLPHLHGDDAFRRYCEWLALPCSRDLAILISLRAVAAFGAHPTIWQLKLAKTEMDEGDVAGLAATLAGALSGRPVDDPHNAEPVELSWGAMRFLYMALGDADAAGRDFALRAFVGTVAERFAELAADGVDLFPPKLRSWVFSIIPERIALLGATSDVSSPDIARRVDASFAEALGSLLGGPVYSLPANPRNGWHRLVTDAAAGMLIRAVDRGEPATWWTEALASAGRSPTGWRRDHELAGASAARGAWLAWVALAACRHGSSSGNPGVLCAYRATTVDAVLASAREWQWEVEASAAPVLDVLPLMSLELSLMEPSERVDEVTRTLLPLVANPGVARAMAGQLAPTRPDLAACLSTRAVEIEVFQAAMEPEVPSRRK